MINDILRNDRPLTNYIFRSDRPLTNDIFRNDRPMTNDILQMIYREMNINPLTAKLFNLNFQPLEVVSR